MKSIREPNLSWLRNVNIVVPHSFRRKMIVEMQTEVLAQPRSRNGVLVIETRRLAGVMAYMERQP